jgi:Bacteriophage head to tail connecting protein
MGGIAEELERKAESIKGKRMAIMPFWQELAENFHPFRAQFTRQFYLSEQFADILLTSYPLIVARELANSFAAMLRPRDQDWFSMTVDNFDGLDSQGKRFLEYMTAVQRRAMYDARAQFARATKEADWDFAVFGNAVISRETNMAATALLYRCWHLKDTVWCEQYDGTVGEIYRFWNPPAQELKQKFPKTYPKEIDNYIDNDPLRERRCMHVVIPGDKYDRVPLAGREEPLKFRTPWVSLYLDLESRSVMEAVGMYSRGYILPRWQTVSGSPWAYSPAAVAGLPDARLLQAMTLTLLEAGEMTVRPPIVATEQAVKSDLAIYAGGVTWVDAEYDERLGEAMRPLITTTGGLPIGEQMLKDTREMLSESFYLNKLGLPAPDREMTAYETGQRIQEWIRSALPLFEPVETEYNAVLCEDACEELLRLNAFGSPRFFPQSLRRKQIHFKFESPLHQATERKKGALLLQCAQLIQAAAELDPNSAVVLDPAVALRDALEGIGASNNWMRDPAQVAAILKQRQQQQQSALLTQQVQNAAAAGESLGRAAQTLQGAAA